MVEHQNERFFFLFALQYLILLSISWDRTEQKCIRIRALVIKQWMISLHVFTEQRINLIKYEYVLHFFEYLLRDNIILQFFILYSDVSTVYITNKYGWFIQLFDMVIFFLKIALYFLQRIKRVFKVFLTTVLKLSILETI